ncbi:thioredoxin [Teredinibacter sp. KSP-S5-2]|uniref:thioredoxin n=1 Tax=Teredinibacter sp. KSP-S5-2 TaxID=3034506 RepID=UPI002934FCA5|nr:thioredoxin [Teredinibacter sp. KSP-S5-2]WNO11677.1 thioredoxin [Teredinibacter sp. KSP-S5-2]
MIEQGAYIQDVSEQNAKELLIDESFNRPVVIDFWADWCEPCKNLMPVLEKLANEYAGQFLLAKVNADEQQMIAAQFGVRSLPTVMVMKDGQPVDGFAGAQPEQQVRELLDKYLPKSYDLQLQQAQGLIASASFSEALPILQQAYEDSGKRADIAMTLAIVYIEQKRLAEAEQVLEGVKLVDRDSAYEKVMAELELAKEAKNSPEIDAIKQQLQASPEDRELQLQLAVQYSQNDFYEEALDILFGILSRDLNFKDGEAKKAFTDILAVLGKGDSLAVKYQRKLYTLLY